ncbi:YgcG family protein [Noviherbaspirillum sp. CPCC 100848]|uniref:YgcG family protein n=1 Tax=Noviherbaspirillum album TaxID=3080276 RepID=A0ABU6J365_9BURK|nr:YgcG family protein [Noviherbaspirillum sp. CPCC 100848]MEC4718074.1 YgcG family protein [Noviherbaspirillum sp. CPCC 100848]
MKTTSMARAALLAFTLFWPFIAGAQVAVPPLTGRVTDQTATLTTEQMAGLEQTLQAFEARKGSQLAVLIVPTSAPETIEQYALRVAEQWKLGRKKVDDGAILVVAKNDRALRIEVGYGLEGVLNDATSKRIISETITPRFKQGDFNGGITAGVDQIIRVIDGEPLPEPKGRPAGAIADIGQYVPLIFILVLAVGGILRSVLGRFPGALVTGGAVAVVAWLFAGALSTALGAGVIALLFTLLSGGMGAMGGYGIGGHHGGSGRGGLGRGGFSGGGGGFGGGGASGRW